MFSILSLDVLPFLYWQMFCMIIINFKKLKKMKKEEEKQEGKRKSLKLQILLLQLPLFWGVLSLLANVSPLIKGVIVICSGIVYTLWMDDNEDMKECNDGSFSTLFAHLLVAFFSFAFVALAIIGLLLPLMYRCSSNFQQFF